MANCARGNGNDASNGSIKADVHVTRSVTLRDGIGFDGPAAVQDATGFITPFIGGSRGFGEGSLSRAFGGFGFGCQPRGFGGFGGFGFGFGCQPRGIREHCRKRCQPMRALGCQPRGFCRVPSLHLPQPHLLEPAASFGTPDLRHSNGWCGLPRARGNGLPYPFVPHKPTLRLQQPQVSLNSFGGFGCRAREVRLRRKGHAVDLL
jgi:hypothetical protein